VYRALIDSGRTGMPTTSRRRRELGCLDAPISCLTYPRLRWWWALRKHQASAEQEADEVRRREERDAIPPKAVNRERALSNSGHSCSTTVTKLQLQSRLCALPAELRVKIYEELLGIRQGIHVVVVEGLLHAYRCQWAPNLTMPAQHQHCWDQCFNTDQKLTSTPGSSVSSLGVLGLLLSCRAV
jgi:hypothetical protein